MTTEVECNGGVGLSVHAPVQYCIIYRQNEANAAQRQRKNEKPTDALTQ